MIHGKKTSNIYQSILKIYSRANSGNSYSGMILQIYFPDIYGSAGMPELSDQS
jgi:hypothetical protein